MYYIYTPLTFTRKQTKSTQNTAAQRVGFVLVIFASVGEILASKQTRFLSLYYGFNSFSLYFKG